MTIAAEQFHCSCCGRELPRRKLHALEDRNAYICRRCGLWVALRRPKRPTGDLGLN